MNNVAQTIRSRLNDVDARLDRLKTEIEKATAEKQEFQTTLRVLEGLGVFVDSEAAPSHSAPPTKSRPASEKKKLMLDILGIGGANGKAPAAVHKELLDSGIDDINIGVVRTTLWRTADAGEIQGGEGKYWKHEAEKSFLDDSPAQSSSTGMTPGGTQPSDHANDREASHDDPYQSDRGGGA